MRTFVAVDLDPTTKGVLAELISHLSCKGADVKWVKRQGMHITLKFLGEVPEKKIPHIIHSIRRACDSHDAFPISLKGMGFFPSQCRPPRILWAGIEQSPDLEALHTKIEDGLIKLNFSRETRKFHPHLTIGRVKSKKNLSALLEELDDQRDVYFGNMQVDRVTLYESTLKPTGAEYEVLSEIQLT